jgi:predicted RNA-binding protein with PUA-like domain
LGAIFDTRECYRRYTSIGFFRLEPDCDNHFLDYILYTIAVRSRLEKKQGRGVFMSYFLAKTDPETYSIEQLEQEKKTTWDGVRSAQAVRVIQAMRPGDELFIYHSQGEAALVGVARVISEPRPDPAENKSWIIDIEFVRRLQRPVTLREIKGSHRFDDWSLVRQGRLSTMSVPEEFVDWLKAQEVL